MVLSDVQKMFGYALDSRYSMFILCRIYLKSKYGCLNFWIEKKKSWCCIIGVNKLFESAISLFESLLRSDESSTWLLELNSNFSATSFYSKRTFVFAQLIQTRETLQDFISDIQLWKSFQQKFPNFITFLQKKTNLK